MHIEVVKTEGGFAALAGEWNQLLTKSITDVPFLRHEYLSAWWEHRGGGEWPEGELYILTGRDESGKLLGIAPLFQAKAENGIPVLMLLGSIEISDFLDVIVEKGNLDAFLDAVLTHLMGQEAPEWQCLDWYNVLQDSPTLPALEAAAEKHSLRYRQEIYLPSPNISLPDDFDEYLETLDPKYRREMRRKMRNAAGFFLPVTWYAVEDESTLDEEMGNFADLMRNENQKDYFLTPEMFEQMKAIAKAFFKMDALQLAFLKVGNDYATGVFNIDYGNRIWVYNSGMAEKHANLSPGIVLMGHLLMDAIEKGRTDFDMMRGGEDYKYQMGGVDRFVMRLTVDR